MVELNEIKLNQEASVRFAAVRTPKMCKEKCQSTKPGWLYFQIKVLNSSRLYLALLTNDIIF